MALLQKAELGIEKRLRRSSSSSPAAPSGSPALVGALQQDRIS
jgi:hypothetical protein